MKWKVGAKRVASLCLTLAVMITLPGCGRARSGSSGEGTVAATPAEGSMTVAPGAAVGRIGESLGTVSGVTFAVKDAVFLWRDQADDLTLILSDRAGLCGLLAGGAMPRDAALLTITLKHNTPANRDAPFGPGTYAVRTEGAVADQDVKRAGFVKLDADCRNTLAEGAVRATAGELVLDAISSQEGGAAAGRLNLTFGAAGKLAGPFSAGFCALPEEAPEPRGCR